MKIKKKSFVGKTIKAVSTRFTNTFRIEFTDGTHVVLETEPMGYGIYGFGQYSDGNYPSKGVSFPALPVAKSK